MASIIKSNTYADFNGREILTANNDGDLTTQKTLTPSFAVIRNSNFSIPNNTDTILQFNEKLYDTDNAFSLSTYLFTVPANKAGNYFLHAHARLGSLVSNQYATGIFYKNGAIMDLVWNSNPNSGGVMSAQCTGQYPLVAGDTIGFYIYQNSGAAKNVESQADSVIFTGFRIGS